MRGVGCEIGDNDMKRREYSFKQIGIIHTPHRAASETPVQPVFAKEIRGTVEVFPEYIDAMRDLDGFSYIYLFYYFDRTTQTRLKVKPYLDDKIRGVFATRAPHRPNKIGMSVVRLLRMRKNIIEVEDIDILDGTPLLDIKPYIARFDVRRPVRSGWQDDICDDIAGRRGRRDYKKEK